MVIIVETLIDWLVAQRESALMSARDSSRASDHDAAECYEWKAAGFQAVIDKLEQGDKGYGDKET